MPSTPIAFPDLPDFRVVGPGQPVNLKDFKLADGTPLIGPDGFLIPQARSFATIVNSGTRTYSYRFDEAMRDNWINARAMRRDAFLRGLLEERILPTINREFTVEVDDERDPEQQFVRDGMLRILRSIPNFDVLKRALLDAVWFGRAGVQWTWGRNEEVDNLWSVARWDPVHGDSVQFTFDGVPAILMDAATTGWYASHGATRGPEGDLRPTDRGGTALVLQRPHWRERFAIHQHILEKADFFEGELAGSVQGLGIRGLVYWHYVLRTDALTWMLAYMQAVGQMDLLVFNYPAGNAAAKAQQEANAQQVIGKAAIACPRNPNQNWPAVEQIPMNEAGLRALQALVTDYFDRHIERLIVGQSMSAGADKGTGLGGTGRAEFAKATKDEILVYDSVRLDQTLTNDLLKPLKRYNFPWARFPVRFKSVLPDLQAANKVQSGGLLVQMGIPVKAQEMRDAAGFSAPEPGDETVGAPMMPPGPGGPAGGGGGASPGAGGPPPSWQGMPLMLARGQAPTRYAGRQPLSYMGQACPGGANTFVPGGGWGGTDGPAPASRSSGTQYGDDPLAGLEFDHNGFLVQDPDSPAEFLAHSAADRVVFMRPHLHHSGRIVWRWHREGPRIDEGFPSYADGFRHYFGVDAADVDAWARLSLRPNANRELTPGELWVATGGRAGSNPQEMDWRPDEVMPEDFYGYRRIARPVSYAGNYPRNPELRCLTDLIDRLSDVELQGISVRANANTREVFIDQQAWADYGAANRLRAAAEECGYRAVIQIGGYVPNGLGWVTLYARGAGPTAYADPRIGVGFAPHLTGADRDRARENLAGLFGPGYDLRHIARAAGAIDGTEALFSPDDARHDGVRVDITHPDNLFEAERRFFPGAAGRTMKAEFQVAAPPLRGGGWRRFGDTLPPLRDLGVGLVRAHGAGDYGLARSPDDGLNGYYTWPRFGFQGPINSRQLARLPDEIRAEMQRRGANDLHTLFSLPGGPEAWKLHGSDVMAEFDPDPQSEHTRRYEEYANRRAAELGLPAPFPGRAAGAAGGAVRPAGYGGGGGAGGPDGRADAGHAGAVPYAEGDAPVAPPFVRLTHQLQPVLGQAVVHRWAVMQHPEAGPVWLHDGQEARVRAADLAARYPGSVLHEEFFPDYPGRGWSNVERPLTPTEQGEYLKHLGTPAGELDWRLDEVVPEDFYAFGRGPAPTPYGWLNAPPGGATLNGRQYRSGQFIPATTLFMHTPGRPAAPHAPTAYAPVPGQEPPPAPAAEPEAEPAPPGMPGPAGPEAGLAAGAGPDLNPMMAGPQPVRTPGLAPEDELVEVQSQLFAWQNYPLLRTAYFTGDPQSGLPGRAQLDPVSGDVRSVTLDDDAWMPLLPGYTGTNPGAVRAAAAWLSGQLYGESLVNQYGKGNAKVVVVAGTDALPADSALQDYFKTAGYPIVLDGGESYPALAAKLEGARAAGFRPEVTYVDRPPAAQVADSVERALDMRRQGRPARTTPLAAAIEKNLAARRAALELLFRNPDVPVRVVDRRTTGRFQRRLITDPRQAAQHLAWGLQQDEAEAGLAVARLRQEILARHRAGELPVDIVTGLLGEGWWVRPPVPGF